MRKAAFALPVAALVTAFGATGATAQTTNCMIMGNMINCNTTGGSQQTYDYEGQRLLGRAIGNLIFGNPERRFRRRIGQMLANGDCQGAARYALERGELELGTTIAQSCGATLPASQQSATSQGPTVPQYSAIPQASSRLRRNPHRRNERP